MGFLSCSISIATLRLLLRSCEARQKYFRLFLVSYLLSQPQRHDVNPHLCDMADLGQTLTMRFCKNGYFTFSGC
jgi:hypothetical protein